MSLVLVADAKGGSMGVAPEEEASANKNQADSPIDVPWGCPFLGSVVFNEKVQQGLTGNTEKMKVKQKNALSLGYEMLISW